MQESTLPSKFHVYWTCIIFCLKVLWWYKVLFVCLFVFTKYHGTNMVFQNVLWYSWNYIRVPSLYHSTATIRFVLLWCSLKYCHLNTILCEYGVWYYGFYHSTMILPSHTNIIRGKYDAKAIDLKGNTSVSFSCPFLFASHCHSQCFLFTSLDV